MRKLITPLAITAALLFASQNIFAQVGINTQQPDPSAALDIVGTEKGLLLPRVSLQSLTDNTTVPNPATALLVYNTNAGLGKAGFYYNSGTPANPSWSLVGGGASLMLPFSQTANNFSSLFYINNTNGVGVGSAVTGESDNSIGVKGQTLAGRGIVGLGTGSGTGVFAANTSSGLAMEVSGPLKIAGPGQSPGNGKVLMSDGNGNATWENISGNVAFRASGVLGGGNEIIAGNNVPVKVTFASEIYDIGKDYNDSNGFPHSTFIVPNNGVYHFDAQTILYHVAQDGVTFTLSLIRVRNNVKTVVAVSRETGNEQSSSTISTDVMLQTGDQIHVEVTLFANQNGSISVEPEQSFFSGRLLFKQ